MFDLSAIAVVRTRGGCRVGSFTVAPRDLAGPVKRAPSFPIPVTFAVPSPLSVTGELAVSSRRAGSPLICAALSRAAAALLTSQTSHAGKQSLICRMFNASRVASVSTPTDIGEAKPKMLEYRSKEDRTEMSASAQTMMREYAAFKWPTLNHKGRIARLASQLRMGHRRVRSLYQNEMGVSLRADEMAAIAALQKVEEANKNDFQALQARIARLEAALFQSDEGFHSEQMAAFRASVDGRRGDDEPGSVGQGEG